MHTEKIPVRKMASKNAPHVRTGKFTIRKLGDVVGGQRLNHALHRHDYFFILAVNKGVGIHHIDFIDYEVKDNFAFVLRPGQVHQLTLEPGCTGYLIEFDNAFYQPSNSISDQRFKKAITRNFCPMSPETFSQLLYGLDQVFMEFENKNDGYPEAINAHLDLFFITWKRLSASPQSADPSGNDYPRERYEELMEALETNIHAEKRPTIYANMFNLSLYQLNSITKQIAGKTLSELINDQILLEARRHLLGTTAQIKDIAFNLGYEDVSYFVRFFKKHTGQTPDAFRRHSK